MAGEGRDSRLSSRRRRSSRSPSPLPPSSDTAEQQKKEKPSRDKVNTPSSERNATTESKGKEAVSKDNKSSEKASASSTKVVVKVGKDNKEEGEGVTASVVAASGLSSSSSSSDAKKGKNNDGTSSPKSKHDTEETKPSSGSSTKKSKKRNNPNTTSTTTATSSPPTTKKPKPPNPYDNIKYTIVTNDGQHRSLVLLVGLKSLFAKQLPKMPKEYIARLVFDRRHTSLALLNPDERHRDGDDEVIGGICYRAYPEMRFAEIAFCAVSASQQVKGYGTKLMNLLKRHAVSIGVEYFITYADNYAIGYFKKQGFTKSISMPKGRFQGLIKDYDGGTMMECYIHPSIDFTRVPEMIKAQRNFIMERIRLVAKSHKVVYPPLPKGWKPNLDGVSRANEAAARAMAIPGVAEAGWTMADLLSSTGGAKDADRQKNYIKSELLSIVRKTEEQQFAWPFREPVDTNEVTDYLEIVKDPIDLSTIEKRIRRGDWYKSKQMLYADLMRMVNNCKLYNDSSSPYYECAVQLEKFLSTIFPDM